MGLWVFGCGLARCSVFACCWIVILRVELPCFVWILFGVDGCGLPRVLCHVLGSPPPPRSWHNAEQAYVLGSRKQTFEFVHIFPSVSSARCGQGCLWSNFGFEYDVSHFEVCGEKGKCHPRSSEDSGFRALTLSNVPLDLATGGVMLTPY